MLSKELENLVMQEREIIPFLKKLTVAERRELGPFLKRMYKKIAEFKSFEERISDKKIALLEMACFVCLSKTDVKKTVYDISNLAINDTYLENIIPWYIPKWYSEVINEDPPWSLTYLKAMRLYSAGLLQPSDSLIRELLPKAMIDAVWVKANKRVLYYRPEQLLKYPITLQKHIWLLFEEETIVHNVYEFNGIENYSDGNAIWIDTICKLVDDGELDRKKVLIKTINTATKGFNKNLSGWFYNLLIRLSPTEAEIVEFQSELFSALYSPHSKVVNTVLKYIKTIVNHKQFQLDAFLDSCSILLNTETKSVVNATLIILDKVAKIHANSTDLVSIKSAEALLFFDEKIQLRAAKIIQKYGTANNQSLLDVLQLYSGNLFHSSKTVLSEYSIVPETLEEVFFEGNSRRLSEDNELPQYSSLDDLIFFVSQSMNNNESYHIDLLLHYAPKLSLLLDETNVRKLEPVFKRSFEFITSQVSNAQVGYLEFGAASFLNDFANILLKKYPVAFENLNRIKNKKIKELQKERFYASYYKNSLQEIENQSVPDYIYVIYRALFIRSKYFITEQLDLSLLSTPTHFPCWLDPTVLIERLLAYEQLGQEIDLFDFQIAIGRLPSGEKSAQLNNHIDRIVNSEIQQVLRYHYGYLPIQEAEVSKPELWIQSVLSRNIDSELEYFQDGLANSLQTELGAYEWNCNQRDEWYQDYDHKLQKLVKKKRRVKELRLEGFPNSHQEKPSEVLKIKRCFSGKEKKEVEGMYRYLKFKKHEYYTVIQPNDELRFLYLSPNNPNVLLGHMIHTNLKYSTFYEESGKKNMINFLKGLHEIWYRKDVGEITYLFLATGFLCSEKVARDLAAEIWINANSEHRFNNQLIGEAIGKLEREEYAPLKRFTDLITASLFNVSKQHNECLYDVLSAVICTMAKEPIRGTKKLLEIFMELQRSFPNREFSVPLRDKLVSWKENKSLNKIIELL
ncbi:conserved hypothetical protein [Tenacibaculum litopenaei]|uniref:DUF6493 family protein n=1 Tax=Tenacibaculum litopenaei TaxID=396016 RepID=UPI003893CD9E